MAAHEPFAPVPSERFARSYVIYNNKGIFDIQTTIPPQNYFLQGEWGKTTVVFNFAAELACRLPNKKILIIDLDSHCNSSSLCLGGGQVGQENALKMNYVDKKSVLHFFQEAEYDNYRKVPNLAHFMVNVVTEREIVCGGSQDQVPNNLYLVCGSVQLDLDSSELESYASTAPSRAKPTPFFNIYNLLCQGIKNLGEDYIVVFDTNPSFTIITRLALVAAEELIVPTTIDEFSGGGVRSLLLQIGLDTERNEQGNLFSNSFKSFLERHQNNEELMSHQYRTLQCPKYEKLPIAKVRTILINRVPRKNLKAVMAIKSSFHELIAHAFLKTPELFAPPHVSTEIDFPNTKQATEFVKTYYFHEISDIAGTMNISHNLGIPIACLSETRYTMRFPLHALEGDDADEGENKNQNNTKASAGPDSVRFANQVQDLVELALNSSNETAFQIPGVVRNTSGKLIEYDLTIVAPCLEGQGPKDDERRGRRITPIEANEKSDWPHWHSMESEQFFRRKRKNTRSASTTTKRSRTGKE